MVDFIYIGASRAGSTWMYHILDNHPDIIFPLNKNPRFWNRHFVGGNFLGRHHELRSVEWYKEQMDQFPAKKVGDFTDGYSQIPLERIKIIKKTYPNIKVLYCIRNPIEITMSHVALTWRKNTITGDDIKQILEKRDQENSVYENYLRHNVDFTNTLKKWLTVFPKNQFKYYRFEEIKNNPKILVNSVFKFIGVKEYELPGNCLTEKVNSSRKNQILFTDDAKQFLIDWLQPNIIELEKYLDLDLAEWISNF